MGDQVSAGSAIRIGAVCCVYDDKRWIAAMTAGIYPGVARIFFLVGEEPWNGVGVDLGDTLSTISTLPDPGQKIEIVRGRWTSETEQRNYGLQLCRSRGYGYCMVVDADEVYDPQAVERMGLAAAANPQVGAWYVGMFTYWKSYRYRIEPPEQFKPVVLVRCDGSEFIENRHVKAQLIGQFPPQLAVCHHLSYARNDEEVKNKLSRFSHSHEIVPNWYERVWKEWDNNPEMENLHPVHPQIYGRAVLQHPESYPPALKVLYDLEQRGDLSKL